MQALFPNANVFVVQQLDAVAWANYFPEKGKSACIIVDENTRQYCLPAVQPFLPESTIVEIPSGEANKNIDTCQIIWKALLDHSADRKAVILNLGGGVIGDMGGFVASTYKRGISFVQMPTTLLSQVDASVGGKLGIDFNGLKNVIGVFQQPEAVIIHGDFLHTLPDNQLMSGFAEILKHGLIADAAYWSRLQSVHPAEQPSWEDIVAHSVAIKQSVVTADPYEKGRRKILNFGHTLGHAIETWSLTAEAQPLLHGEAIAIGMICETYLSQQYTGLSDKEATEIVSALQKWYPKHSIPAAAVNGILGLLSNDKKNDGNNVMYSLLRAIGDCTYDVAVPAAAARAALDFYQTL
jgi:3-dehydroquinate synthase